MSLLRVKLLIDTSSSWGRDLIRGVSAYVRQHGGWALDLEYRGRYEKLHLPADWRGHGIIARVTNPQIAREIVARGLPAVNVSWFSHGSPEIARCTNNETSFGRLMADYLLLRGFRSFAYFGASRPRPGYSDRVKENFAATLAAAGFPVKLWRDPARKSAGARSPMADWLRGLPRPVGVGVWSDDVGRKVAHACHIAGLKIPDDVAVISAEYDALMNSLSDPPLTTVDYLTEHVGYEAAALLDRMLGGDPPPADGVIIEPLGVITRQSTETTSVPDALVVAALKFIRQKLHQPIQVTHLTKELKVARRGLEQRFRKVLGRSVAEEIRRVRMDYVKKQLRDTVEPVSAIAAACGFLHPEVLTRSFHREFGLSPSDFRRQYRVCG
jgi:LacI family transcriptional regulator